MPVLKQVASKARPEELKKFFNPQRSQCTKSEQIAMLKSKDMLNQLQDDESDTDVVNKNLIDRYQHRQRELHSMCLAEFATTFVTNYHHNDNDCDALPPTESEIMSKIIQLTDGYGKMN